jgi:hypothetical protein
MKGQNVAPVKKITPSAFLSIAQGHKKAFFDYKSAFEGGNGVVTITFTAVIYVDMAVKDSELKEVLEHENRHFADFKNLASALNTNMQRWLGVRKDAAQDELQSWLDWFDYDTCVASAKFHRSIGAVVPICITPSSTRPK